MKTIAILLAALHLVAGYTSTALAHSTKGRIRVTLDKAQPTADDFAYFMESYVHRKFYEGKNEKWKGRFYVKDFVKVEQQGDRATVHFITIDFKAKTRGKTYKGNSEFPDSMTFHRDQDGWFYQPDKGESVRVYTYVQKWGYYYQRYILPGAGAGVTLAVVALAALRLPKKRKNRFVASLQKLKTKQ